MDIKTDIEALAEEFENCRKVLIALGDENRQHLILEMMRMGNCSGARVGDITVRTHLSRPAVSHQEHDLRFWNDFQSLIFFCRHSDAVKRLSIVLLYT